jgi:hypothetical protein
MNKYELRQIIKEEISKVLNESTSTEIYKSNPDVELYKVINFPNGGLQDKKVKDVLNTICLDAYGKGIDDILDNKQYSEEVEDYLKGLQSREQVYVYPDGKERISMYNSLENYSDEYQSEEEWEVEGWKDITNKYKKK